MNLLKNSFSEETRKLFLWNYTCWACNKNHADCLHHILGRVSTSPLNVAPLSNFDCHIGNGKLSTFEIKKKFLKKTLEYLFEMNYKFNLEDIQFKEKYKKYYE